MAQNRSPDLELPSDSHLVERGHQVDRFKSFANPEYTDLDLLYIDVSRDSCNNINSLLSSSLVTRLWDVTLRAKKVTLNMETEEYMTFTLSDWSRYYWADEVVSHGRDFTLRITAWTSQQYTDLLVLLGDKVWNYPGRMELYVGGRPIHVSIKFLRYLLLRTSLVGHTDKLPLFTSYSVFATPFLPFTPSIFLLDIFPGKQLDLPPSRLEHLELTLEIDTSDPDRSICYVDSFFRTLSPKIRRLALRLRTTGLFDHAHGISFTDHFFSGLRSCQHLGHLELGGFGYSLDFLSRLSTLPVSTLILHPLGDRPALLDIFELLKDPSTNLARSLKVLDVRDIDDDHRAETKLELLCEERRVKLSHRGGGRAGEWAAKEAELMTSSMKSAGTFSKLTCSEIRTAQLTHYIA